MPNATTPSGPRGTCGPRGPAAHDRLSTLGVEFTQEPIDRYGHVDAGFRDPSGNGWKMIESRR